jgi:ABC-2 type transport system permease protein
MTRGIMVVMRKELKEIGSEGSGGRRGRLTPLVGVAVAGILFPLNFGTRYVHTEVMIVMGLMLPVLFVLPIVADTFAGERERHTLETLLATRLPDRAILFGKLGAIVVYAFVLTTLSLAMGLTSVNIANPEARPLLIGPSLLAGVLIESMLAATLMAAVGLLISLGATTVRQAQQRTSIVLLVPMLIPAVVSKLPETMRGPLQQMLGAGRLTPMQLVFALLVTLDAIVLYASMRRFRRSRLTAG